MNKIKVSVCLLVLCGLSQRVDAQQPPLPLTPQEEKCLECLHACRFGSRKWGIQTNTRICSKMCIGMTGLYFELAAIIASTGMTYSHFLPSHSLVLYGAIGSLGAPLCVGGVAYCLSAKASTLDKRKARAQQAVNIIQMQPVQPQVILLQPYYDDEGIDV